MADGGFIIWAGGMADEPLPVHCDFCKPAVEQSWFVSAKGPAAIVGGLAGM